MIDRYSLPAMKSLWDLDSKYNFWLKVEIAVCEAYAEIGKISKEDFEIIKDKARFSVNRINEIEIDVKHDLIAFVTCIAENVGEVSRYIHMGLTSSDVIDTALSLQIKESSLILLDDMERLIKLLRYKALEHKNTVMIGRSHGVHAEPTTLGLKFALWYDITSRNYQRLKQVSEDICTGKISGAVGTYANVDPKIEEIVCRILDLKPAKISTQIIQRDLHANYIQTLALIASSIELFATEIRCLQRTDVLELEEGFSKNQKGSSAMPHKRNPISSENLCGLARIMRSYSIAALENIPLWHERDISHSSAERIMFPDSAILMDYMLNRLINTVENLQVYPENMLRNMNKSGGVIFSQQVLLKLVEKGMLRDDAYKLVQNLALMAWNNTDGDFKSLVTNDNNILKNLTLKEVESCFDPSYHLKHVNYIFEKLGIN